MTSGDTTSPVAARTETLLAPDFNGPSDRVAAPGWPASRSPSIQRWRGPVVVTDLDADADTRTRTLPSKWVTDLDGQDAESSSQARVPVGRLVGLAGSGAFAFWTSLTCFVC